MQRKVSHCKKKLLTNGSDYNQGECSDYSDFTFNDFETANPVIKEWIEQCTFNNFH